MEVKERQTELVTHFEWGWGCSNLLPPLSPYGLQGWGMWHQLASQQCELAWLELRTPRAICSCGIKAHLLSSVHLWNSETKPFKITNIQIYLETGTWHRLNAGSHRTGGRGWIVHCEEVNYTANVFWLIWRDKLAQVNQKLRWQAKSRFPFIRRKHRSSSASMGARDVRRKQRLPLQILQTGKASDDAGF